MIFNDHCKNCYQLDRTTGRCDKYNQPLTPTTIGSTIKWIKCQKCVDAQAKKEKDEGE